MSKREIKHVRRIYVEVFYVIRMKSGVKAFWIASEGEVFCAYLIIESGRTYEHIL